MYILGISGLYHDSAAALIKDSDIITAVQEERITRIKHDSSFPINSIRYILEENKISLEDISYVVFYDKPFLKFERLLETYLHFAPKGFRSFKVALPIWIKEKLFLKNFLLKELKNIYSKFDKKRLLFSEHHMSHAASAFYPSPFTESLILILDGVGEWSTTTVARGKKNKINILKEIKFPNSLGLLYSAFTYFTGFKVNSGEYKLMGLAPYGEPKYVNLIKTKLIDIKDDGSFRLNQKYFNYSTGLTMTNQNFNHIFGRKPRNPNKDQLEQFHMDLAASIQNVIEEVILKICRNIQNEYKIDNLCLAGGVALNCVANGKILDEKIFKKIWIQPAAGDAGGALGSALLVWHNYLNNERLNSENDKMKGSYLGKKFQEKEVYEELEQNGAKFTKLNFKNIIENAVRDLKSEKAIGWFQGKMEFGPRALGGRSILADPRSNKMQKLLNLKVKFRESFRPFAPAILREDLDKWFDINIDSPYMLLVSQLKKEHQINMTADQKKLFGIDKLNIKRSSVPAVTHVDYSARVQTVHKETNEIFWKLLNKFKLETGCPLLVNTSFNVRGEPIVFSPTDAFKCFMGTNLDVLIIENFYMVKQDQDSSLLEDYKNKYELD